MVYFKVLSRHSPEVPKGNHENPLSIVCATVEIQTRHLLNTSQNLCHFSQLVWLDIRVLSFCLSVLPVVEIQT
jgi:hypothetical protein